MGPEESRMDVEITRKNMVRIMPLLVACYFVAYLDRFNISYAGLTMNKSLGFSSEMFGFGAGLFFLGYVAFGIPSNILLHKYGAKSWITGIMICWGLMAAFMSCIHGYRMFYTVRFLLGLGEAGFLPGVIYYLGMWFPTTVRARMIAFFMLAIPVTGVVGAPISGLILQYMNGVGGWESWRWLFLIEGLPAVLLGVVLYFTLVNKPENAPWLSDAEKLHLTSKLRREAVAAAGPALQNKWAVFVMPRVIGLALIYFCGTTTVITFTIFLPLIVKSGFGLGVFATSMLSIAPYLVGTVAMYLIGASSDRRNERRGHLAFTLFIGALGVGIAGYLHSPGLQLACLCIGSIGIFGMHPPFWAFASFLSGEAAALAIGLINSISQLGGFFGPTAMGHLRRTTGNYALALLLLAALRVIAGVAVLLMKDRRRSLPEAG